MKSSKHQESPIIIIDGNTDKCLLSNHYYAFKAQALFILVIKTLFY